MKPRGTRFAGWGQAMLAGALFATFIGRLQPDSPRRSVLALILAGGLYGLGVLGLIRLFRTRSFGFIAAGLLAGPFPIAVLIGGDVPEGERGGIFLIGAILGLFVGLLEWARVRGRSGELDRDPEVSLDAESSD